MKHSKLKLFTVWLLAIAFIFSSFPLSENVFAEETQGGESPSVGKNVSERISWFNEKTSIYRQSGGQSISVMVEGNPSNFSIGEGSTLELRYSWEIPHEVFVRGKDGNGERIQPGDFFELPIDFDPSFFAPFKNNVYKLKDEEKSPEVEFGTYRFVEDGGKMKLIATFDEDIKDYTEMVRGHLSFNVRFSKAGVYTIGPSKDSPLTVTITAKDPFSAKWDPKEVFDKWSEYSMTEPMVRWGFGVNMEQIAHLFQTEPKFQKKENIVFYDYLPHDAKFKAASLRVSMYAPRPEAGKENSIDPNDYTVLTARNPRTVTAYFKGDQIVRANITQYSEEEFIDLIRDKGKTKPTLGILNYVDQQNRDREMIVIGLGNTPSDYTDEYGTYGNFIKKFANKDLDDFFKKLVGTEANAVQIERMKQVYSVDQKIAGWHVSVETTVKEANQRYGNNATMFWNSPSTSGGNGGGGTGSGSGVSEIHSKSAQTVGSYAVTAGGATGIIRGSFVVSKLWNGKESDKIEFDLLADGKVIQRRSIIAPAWNTVITGLPVFREGSNEMIEYTVKEVQLQGYKAPEIKYEKDANKELKRVVITNTELEGEKIDIKVRKEWIGEAQELADVTLIAKAGEEILEERSATLYPRLGWTHTFKNLPKKHLDQEIEYSIHESQVAGYQKPRIKKNVTPTGFEFVVTNEAIKDVPKKNLVLTKTWEGKKLSEAHFEIYRTMGGSTEKIGDTVVLNEENGWTHTIRDLAVLDEHNNPVKYSVKEIKIAGYDAIPTESQTDGELRFDFVNKTAAPGKIRIPVQKVWKDKKGENLKPEDITVDAVTVIVMKRDKLGEETEAARADLKKDADWRYIFELEKTEDEIYSVREIAVEGYEVTVEPQGDNGYLITNTKKEEQNDGTIKPKSTTPTSKEDKDGEEETTAKATESSAPSSADASTETSVTTENDEEETEEETTTEETTETTTRTAAETTAEVVTASSETTTAAAVVTTTGPATTRTLTFIEISEDIPLGVKTTAPLDLELYITEEAVALSGLPYTASIPFELFVGFGMLILTIGLTLGRRL